MTESVGFKSVRAAAQANSAAGEYWFSYDTKQFFQSRVESNIQGGFYWIESQRNYDDSGREFKVVACAPSGVISYLRNTESFATKAEAQAIIDTILEGRRVDANP